MPTISSTSHTSSTTLASVPPEQAIRAYLSAVQDARQRGNATEHSYRPAMQALLIAFAPAAQVTNEPKRIQCGAPDFSIARTARSIGAPATSVTLQWTIRAVN